jgi:hypothetical protein
MRTMTRRKTHLLQVENVPPALLKEAKLQAMSEDKTVRMWFIEALQEKLKRSDPNRRFNPAAYA